jgi:hypothetical protein
MKGVRTRHDARYFKGMIWTCTHRSHIVTQQKLNSDYLIWRMQHTKRSMWPALNPPNLELLMTSGMPHQQSFETYTLLKTSGLKSFSNNRTSLSFTYSASRKGVPQSFSMKFTLGALVGATISSLSLLFVF